MYASPLCLTADGACADLSGDDGAFAWILSPVDARASDSDEDATVSAAAWAVESFSQDSDLLLELESEGVGEQLTTENASDFSVFEVFARSIAGSRKVSAAPTRKRQTQHLHTRRRLEITALRERVRGLAEHLARLQGSLGRNHSAALEAEQVQWRNDASRQLGLLRSAQSENADLRATLAAQKKLAKNLQRLLQMRAAKVALLSDRLGVFRVRDDYELSRDSDALFARMIADLDAMNTGAASTIAAFEQNATVSESYRRWHVRLDDTGLPCLDVVSCAEFPFSSSELASAIRALLHHRKSGIRVHDAQPFGGSRDIVATDYRLLDAAGATRNHRQRRVSRSLPDAGARSLTVSVGFIDSIDALGRPTPGFMLKVQMWIVRTEHAVTDPATQRTQRSTCMQNFTTITPVVVRGAKAFRWSRSSVENTLIPLWDREISSRQQRLEDALMDQRNGRW